MTPLPATLFEDIRAKYEKSLAADRWQAAWQAEEASLRETLEDISKRLDGTHELVRPLGVGGSGLTILLRRPDDHEDLAVLKLPRPAVGVAERLDRNLRKEMHNMRRLRHQNVIRVLAYSESGQADPAYYIMEFLDDVDDADNYFEKQIRADPKSTNTTLIHLVDQALQALEYVHSQQVVHLDIKPPNLFVDGTGLLVLADFGFAKKLDESGLTSGVGGTKQYMHPNYFELMTTEEEDDRLLAERLEREQIQYKWDLYSLGASILVLLRIADNVDPRHYSCYERRYLRLLATRLLDGKLAHARVMGIPVPERILGLSEDALTQLAYDSAAAARQDIRKLLGETDLKHLAPETSRYSDAILQAASHGAVPFSPRVQALLETPELRSLATLPQLGLVTYIYPTASHSRLEHTLGTFAMTTRFARGLFNDPVNPVFRQIMQEEDITTLLAAAIVHDIGHYPLAHDLEEVEASVFGHETRTAHLVDAKGTALREVLESEWAISVERLRSILSVDRDRLPLRDQILKSILDGPLDADKLDYLIRDSENLRIPYGAGIDYERLVHYITVAVEERLNRSVASLAIHENGKIAAESVAFARYALYGAVYWHRTHRAAKAMLQRLAYEALRSWKDRDAVRKEGYLKQLRIALYDFLDQGAHEQRLPGVLGESRDKYDRVLLDRGATEVVRWLDEQGGYRATILVKGLLERDLYKRALVVSKGFSSSVRWPLVERVFGGEGERWEDRLRASELLQKALVERAGQFATRGETVSTVTPTDADRFVARGASEPLILLDYPPDKPGARTELKILREREGAQPGEDDFSLSSLEASSVWGRLREEAPNSLAKLRVFCHPRFRAVLRVIVDRASFEQLVDDAIGEVAS
ncbi:MAG: protein kinase domain-containing protein [Gammaproteobacteria bacterium]